MQTVKEKKSHQEIIEELARAHKIKTLKQGETAIYQLIEHGIAYSNGQAIKRYPSCVQIKDETAIFHPHTKEYTPLVYVKGSRAVRQPDGTDKYEEIREQIFFEDRDSGVMIVTAKDKNLYYHLEMSDENESKEGRDTSVKAKYRRLDSTKSAEEKLDLLYDKEYVYRLIKEMEVDELKATALEYNVNSARSVAEVKYDLITIAQKDPQAFIRNSGSPAAKMRALIIDAKFFGYVKYDGIERKWSLDMNNEVTPLIEIAPGQDPEEGLSTFLRSKDGDKIYKKLRDKLKS
jgi:hypothetical protein